MLEREALKACEFAEGEAADPVGMDHPGAGCGHAARELVPVLGDAVAGSGGVDVVVGPAGGDMTDGVVDGCPRFEACAEGLGGMGGFGVLGEGFAWALLWEGGFVSLGRWV